MSTAIAAAKKTDVESVGASSQTSSNVGRIQVSGNRLRRFYVFAARRLFAAAPQMSKIQITALGSAITSAIGIAHELVEMKCGSIADVQTFYQPLKPSETEAPSTNPEHASSNGRSIARILIVIDRNPTWTPEDSDLRRPVRRTGADSVGPNGATGAAAANSAAAVANTGAAAGSTPANPPPATSATTAAAGPITN